MQKNKSQKRVPHTPVGESHPVHYNCGSNPFSKTALPFGDFPANFYHAKLTAELPLPYWKSVSASRIRALP